MRAPADFVAPFFRHGQLRGHVFQTPTFPGLPTSLYPGRVVGEDDIGDSLDRLSRFTSTKES